MGLPHRSVVWAHSRYRAKDPVPPINVCLTSLWITRAHHTPCRQSAVPTNNSLGNAQYSREHEKRCTALCGYATANSNN